MPIFSLIKPLKILHEPWSRSLRIRRIRKARGICTTAELALELERVGHAESITQYAKIIVVSGHKVTVRVEMIGDPHEANHRRLEHRMSRLRKICSLILRHMFESASSSVNLFTLAI